MAVTENFMRGMTTRAKRTLAILNPVTGAGDGADGRQTSATHYPRRGGRFMSAPEPGKLGTT
jgi:hypothetical protein